MTREDLTRVPSADPTEIYRWRDGMYGVDLLTAAVAGLDLFNHLAGAPADLPGLCRALSIHERPADVLTTLLAAMGLLRREGGALALTDLAREHFVKGSPWDLTAYYAAFRERPVCRDLLQVLKTGKPARWGSFKEDKDWARAMEDEAFAAQFTAVMDSRGAFLGPAAARALDLRGQVRLLDVAGGSGIYACAIAARNPHIQATVIEKPPVDGVARKAIARRGYADRVDVAAGDMFREIPGGHDVHLFSNVLHDWDVPVVKDLLAMSFRALPPGGLVVVHDAHLNAEKTGPLPVAMYSVILVHSTEGRCYSVAEIESHLREAGFIEPRFTPTAADRSVVVARKPR